jgi:hypothetical protein
MILVTVYMHAVYVYVCVVPCLMHMMCASIYVYIIYDVCMYVCMHECMHMMIGMYA